MLRLLAQREEGYEDIGALMGLSVGEVAPRSFRDGGAQGDGPDPASGDQKALLRLLAQREEGYEDIGALMGLSASEVAQSPDALAELDRSASAHAPTGPKAPHRLLLRARAGRAPATASTGPLGQIAARQTGACWPRSAAASLIVILLILFATGAIDVGGDSGSTRAPPKRRTRSTTPKRKKKFPPRRRTRKSRPRRSSAASKGAKPKGARSSAGSNRRCCSSSPRKVFPPRARASSYAISLARSPSERIPIARDQGRRNRARSAASSRFRRRRWRLLASGFDEMEVSLVPNDELRVAVTEAQKQKKTPQFGGTDVLRGPVTGPVIEDGRRRRLRPRGPACRGS